MYNIPVDHKIDQVDHICLPGSLVYLIIRNCRYVVRAAEMDPSINHFSLKQTGRNTFIHKVTDSFDSKDEYHLARDRMVL